MISERGNTQSSQTIDIPHEEVRDSGRPPEDGALVVLFRLLMREPHANHDFRTCTICKEYGVIEI